MEVTRAHYNQLRDIVNRKYMGHDDSEYDGNHNVLSDKLEFLRSLPAAEPLSPPHPNDDDYEIDSFFPFSLRYLDLSTLKLTIGSDRYPLPLLLRQEYDHISRLTNKRHRDGLSSVLLSGQPGTGELVSSSHWL